MEKRGRKRAAALLLVFLLLTAGLCGCSNKIQDIGETLDQVQSVIGGNEPLQVESVSQDKYVYGTLDDTTKQVYDEIVYAIQNREESVPIATTDISVMENAYQAVRCDYCEFFWLDQFSYVTYSRDEEITSIEVTPTYSMSEEEQADIQRQIDAEADRMLAGAPTDGTDYEKALYVYETLISEINYSEDAENNQNIISAFINHETVCQGYAYATQYLLTRLGIPCTTVEGVADGENHAWNLVKMDGDYYYIDTTWGNSQYIYRDEDSSEEEEFWGGKYIDYDYFGATTEALMATHSPDERIALPECTATADNYYVHEGLYVDTWDPELIGGMISDGFASGADVVQIKFSDTELYEQAWQYFMEEANLWDYCEGIDTVNYMENVENNVLFIKFPGNGE